MNRNPEAVIVDYLRDLLQEDVPPSPPAELGEPPKLTLAARQAQLELLKRQQLQALLDGSLHRPSAEVQPLPRGDQGDAAETVVQGSGAANTLPAPAELMAWCENGRPAWAQTPFDILSFNVAGLTLAVPLVALGQIVHLSHTLTPIFGQAKWFMGILPTHFGNLRVLDTAQFVMPERYSPDMRRAAGMVISIDRSPWGMAVDRIGQPQKIDPSAVVWRTQRSKRLWLAGTLSQQMCALIDVPQMARLLASAEPAVH